jgi:hypothetical protein
MLDLEAMWNSTKELAIAPDWKRRAQDEFVRLVCPLDVDGITVQGLQFTGSAHIYSPERSVTFQIEYHPPLRTQRGGPIARVEWRPRSPHSNKGVGPLQYRFLTQAGCHYHPFDLNWAHSQSEVRKGNLPIATPIESGLASLQEALAFTEKMFRIETLKGVPVPPWTERIL